MADIRLLLGESVLTTNGKEWHHKRRALNSSFQPLYIKSCISPIMTSMTEKWIKILEDNLDKELDMHEWIAKVTFDIIGKRESCKCQERQVLITILDLSRIQLRQQFIRLYRIL